MGWGTPTWSDAQARSQRVTLLCAPLLGLTACLQINPDFSPLRVDASSINKDSTGSDPDLASNTNGASGTDAHDAIDSAGTASSTDPQSPTTQPNPTGEPIGENTGSSGSTSSDTPSQSAQTSQSSTSSTSSTTSTGTFPVTWIPINVDARQVTSPVPSGYPFSIEIDHAGMVAAGAAANGSDLAVVASRGGNTISLNRVLDPDASWNTATTKIWFALDQSMAPGTLNTTEYFVVVNDAGITPVSDLTTMFLRFDDFEGASLDPTRWASIASTLGTRSVSKIAEGIRFSATLLASYPMVYYSIQDNAQAYPAGIRVEAKTRFNATNLSGTCGRLFPFVLRSEWEGAMRAALRSDLSSYGVLTFNDALGVNDVQVIGSVSPTQGQWQMHALDWVGQDMRYYRGSTQLLQTQGVGTVKTPDQTSMILELFAGVRRDGCTGNGSLEMDVDWIRVRPYMSPAPDAWVD